MWYNRNMIRELVNSLKQRDRKKNVMKKVVISVILAILITYVILLVPAALIYWLASLILGIDFLWKNTFIIAGIFTIIRILFSSKK